MGKRTPPIFALLVLLLSHRNAVQEETATSQLNDKTTVVSTGVTSTPPPPSSPAAPCELKSTFLGSKKIYTCTNVTGGYLEAHEHLTNRSEWFHCAGCTLPTLTERTLHRFAPKTRIQYLNVSACRIERIADFAFRELPNLKLLLARDNRLASLTGATLHSLRRLLQLDLSRNRLVRLGDDAFVHLGALDILNLNSNRLRELTPRAFAGLRELKYLYLSHNALASVPARAFADLVNLRILYAEHNHIATLAPLAFANLRRLQYLYLNHNALDALAAYNFKELADLVDLQLRENALEEVGASAFNGLRRLKFLHLGANNVSTLARHAFAGLDALTVLDLANNSLSSFSMEFLADMPELRGLWLERNRIEALPPATLLANRTHRNLASLDLKHNRLEYFNYKLLLRHLECLEEIYVGGNRFRCEFFVPMYDYFEESNVTLCVDARCDRNATIWYTETLCRLSYGVQATDDDGEDALNVDEVLAVGVRPLTSFYAHLIYCIVFIRFYIGE